MTSDLGTYIICQFSNWMSSSQFQCHRDVINDTKVRIGANTSRTVWRRGARASAWVPSIRSRNRRVTRVSKVSRDCPRGPTFLVKSCVMSVGGPPSGVVTFLFTDIEGSTHRWEADVWSAFYETKFDPISGLDFSNVLGDTVCAKRRLERRLSRVARRSARHRVRSELVHHL